MSQPSPTRERAIESVAFVTLYFALDWLSTLQPIESVGFTPWNPPAGLSFAYLLWRGWRAAPSVAFAAALAELGLRGAGTTLAHALGASLWFAVSYAGLAAWIARRRPGGVSFDSVADASWFLGVISVGTGVVSLGVVASLELLGPAFAPSFVQQALQYWIGDAIGVAALTPALLLFPRVLPARAPRAETLLQAAALTGGLLVLFLWDADLAPRRFYALFLPLIWISVRRGVTGAAFALAAIQGGLVLGLALTGVQGATVLDVQLRMFVLALTGLLLGAAISQQKDTARKLRERQGALDSTLRLAAASETASALAHELNQPLSAITSYLGAAQLLLTQPARDDARLAGAIAGAAREATRAGEIVRRLREFFRSGAKNTERVGVEPLVLGALRAMQPSLESRSVELRIRCEAGVGHVLVDRVQLESVLHQLVGNAIEAMSEAGSKDPAIEVVATGANGVVRVEVRDSGPGIDPELGDAIFSPFKTTKPLGTGLGLSISRTIVENHGGTLSVVPAASGAHFVLTLPSAP
jgi:signal transduction histidine kinase